MCDVLILLINLQKKIFGKVKFNDFADFLLGFKGKCKKKKSALSVIRQCRTAEFMVLQDQWVRLHDVPVRDRF